MAEKKTNPVKIAKGPSTALPKSGRAGTERVIWENDDWIVTDRALRSKWIEQWKIPAHRLIQIRDLAAANLSSGPDLYRPAFLSALQAALAAHHPKSETIAEMITRKSGEAGQKGPARA